MLTTKQVRDVHPRVKIFQSRIYLNTCSQGALSDAVKTGIDPYSASWHEQGSPWVYNPHEDVNPGADVFKKHPSLGRRRCECCAL